MTLPPFQESPEAARARRRRSVAIALGLGAFVILVFVISLIRLSQHGASPTHF